MRTRTRPPALPQPAEHRVLFFRRVTPPGGFQLVY